MGNLELIFETKGFRGVNNVADPARVLPSGKGSFLTWGENIDIDNELMARRRDGFGAPFLTAKPVSLSKIPTLRG